MDYYNNNKTNILNNIANLIYILWNISIRWIFGIKIKNGGFRMNILMEDIPYGLCAMVEIVGMDKFVEICKLYGGSTVYIPVHSKVTLAERNRQLVKDYNGKNIDALRVKYGISNQQIKRILSENDAL